jgi:hypothetical protein
MPVRRRPSAISVEAVSSIGQKAAFYRFLRRMVRVAAGSSQTGRDVDIWEAKGLGMGLVSR